MPLIVDIEKGKQIAPLLNEAFQKTGIHGRMDMPEDKPPAGVEISSLEHILFLTLTVAIDYQRDANTLWESARRTYEDPVTRYLFNPKALHEAPVMQVVNDMRKYGLSKKPQKDAYIWRTIGISFHKKWNGDPRNFLEDCGYDGPTVLKRLKEDQHLFNNRNVPDFPYLRGDKIGPLWIRMLRDNVNISHIQNLESVPIPVDIHIARASMCLGVVKGTYEGGLTDIFSSIRDVWAQSVKGHRINDRPMIALDVDEPLWHLSKYGCMKRDPISGQCPLQGECELGEFCVEGKVQVSNQRVSLIS